MGAQREADARAGWDTFVRAQAPALHRAAHALTGDLGEAEALVEAALASRAARWSRDDAPVEASRALVAAFLDPRPRTGAPGARFVVTQPLADGHDPDLARRLPAWRRLEELPPEHRALLVVRHHPDLRDLDPARVLGVRPRDLPAREEAARAAFGDGLDDLGPALAAVGSRVPPVVVDPVAAAQAGRPGRRRRQVVRGVAVVGVAAAVVLLGVRVALSDPAPPPRPPDHHLEQLTPRGARAVATLPRGGPTPLPWWAAGVLHVGGHEFRMTEPLSIATTPRTTVVRSRTRHALVVGDRITGLPGGVRSVRLAPDGHLVAWVDGERVLAAEVGERGLGESLELDLSDLAGPDDAVRVQSVLGDGRVVVQVAAVPLGAAADGGTRGRSVVWMPGVDDGVELDLPDQVRLDFNPEPWSGGLSWLDPDLGTVLVEVSADGDLTPVGAIGYDRGPWNPDGEVVAQVYGAVPYVTRPFAGGFAPSRLPLPTPGDVQWRVVGWESADRLVVGRAGVRFGVRGFVRCQIPSLRCEQVTGGPRGLAVVPG